VPREINLAGRDCIVFLITGSFVVGGTEIAKIGEGHPVVSEGTLQLREDTAVVIIFNPK
jgi:hypothetical protein